MSISRRDALMGATAAAVVTGAITAPLAFKAAGVKMALIGDPVLPAYDAFEAVRHEYIAADNRINAVREAVDAEMPPEPHFGRVWLDLSVAERDEGAEWRRLCNRRVTARLGMDEDNFLDVYMDRMNLAYDALADIQAATVAGLLCQVRAWWNVHETMRDTEVPKPDPEESAYEPKVIVQRLYYDVVRLAGGFPS